MFCSRPALSTLLEKRCAALPGQQSALVFLVEYYSPDKLRLSTRRIFCCLLPNKRPNTKSISRTSFRCCSEFIIYLPFELRSTDKPTLRSPSSTSDYRTTILYFSDQPRQTQSSISLRPEPFLPCVIEHTRGIAPQVTSSLFASSSSKHIITMDATTAAQTQPLADRPTNTHLQSLEEKYVSIIFIFIESV